MAISWGARMMSPKGIFSDNNSDDPNISRYIIFLTDGHMETSIAAYTGYGIEYMDHRSFPSKYSSTIAPLDALNMDAHVARFGIGCNSAKGKGISIWVIAFGIDLDASMRQCASNPSQVMAASNSAELPKQLRISANPSARSGSPIERPHHPLHDPRS
jgi:hypothetical protein